MTASIEELLEKARTRIVRVQPHELADIAAGGGLVVDIRPESLRASQGSLPGALVVERNVLEWRLDPMSEHRLAQVIGHGQRIVLVCEEGYASSLAAASLVDLGFERAGDLDGGYAAWKRWRAEETPTG